ncbi:Dystrophin [Chelonia mydas]|uniref:Dystrophin n=1 Tax=Chelonia mydas TaxID=8469 RepID=M7B443_CHEMY|nr:Dystrophin [Chelonia mydas]
MGAAGSSAGQGMCWPPLPAAPIGLERQTADSGSCDRPNLWTRQENKPVQPARGLPWVSEREAELEAALRLLQRFYLDLEKFLAWLTEAETTANVLQDATHKERILEDTKEVRELMKQWQGKAWRRGTGEQEGFGALGNGNEKKKMMRIENSRVPLSCCMVLC